MKFESIYANYSVHESQEKSELAIQNRRNHREGGGGDNFSFLCAKKLEKFRLFSNEFLFMPLRREYSREKRRKFF